MMSVLWSCPVVVVVVWDRWILNMVIDYCLLLMMIIWWLFKVTRSTSNLHPMADQSFPGT